MWWFIISRSYIRQDASLRQSKYVFRAPPIRFWELLLDHLPLSLGASQTLTAILRLANITAQEKRIVMLKTFFESQFSYCPLLWMFCSRKLNHKINRLHERALRIAYADYTSSSSRLSSYALREYSCWKHFLNLNLAIAHYSGCFVVTNLTTRLIDYTRGL